MPTGKDVVVVTGFGPFGVHKVNASWVAVKQLAKIGLDLDDDDGIDLVTIEIPVSYEQVKRILPELWGKYNPILMIHVGVSAMASELTLEQQAHNKGYTKPDVDGSNPLTQCCVDDSCHEVIRSGIEMSLVCQEVNEADASIKSVVSHDPGRYLCDFSYFTSLHQNKECSAFIHVPPLNTPYTGAEMALGLQLSVQSMLKQVRRNRSTELN